MDERVLRFRVGIVMVAAVIITVILVMLFGAWPTVLQPQYELNVKFPQAPGIAVDTPVRKSGVLIGRVSQVKLLDEGGVLVGARIFDRYKLRQNETCRIGTGSLIGDAVLEFVPSDKAELLAAMDAAYEVLMSFSYPDAITRGLRRRVDQLRGVLERTRGDLTNSRQMQRLLEALERAEERDA